MIVDGFFEVDPETAGSKGLVFIGDRILAYMRDGNTDVHPHELDLPGGGPEPGETPFENFQREVFEEFGIRIEREHIVYAKKYPATLYPDKMGYFPVAILPASVESQIKFGHEGLDYFLMRVDEYLARDDAWTAFQDRTRIFLQEQAIS